MENALKNTTEYFLKFLLMENNFIQMAASAGHALVYTISPIFKHIIDCLFHQWPREYFPLKRQ